MLVIRVGKELPDQGTGLLTGLNVQFLSKQSNVAEIFIRPTGHELAGQNVPEIGRNVQVEFVVGAKEPGIWNVALTQL